ncbi:hypothetical protein C731_2604 [Mycolicibacterium hassiacum DSM 44199]|jgi:hypothetical protein|uniref:Uncharacterized protein n=1 Tax=Mycolicibacterium hassiacum (strain DSM 44199 / CIP 105218 / JCM 12690 / 3849) TaxID=1122247 RepID=K5BEX8_MYCHD|nr:hypothetical protein [Mycolicibacterium hassiacum]EKF23387.1 hypothetical protein C731_2604 [Mycolicibacterium hassiacum DSM 44199]MBX5489005.1 hypothetical protein [Mycolicibacterium hassiacum]MDA4088054.1 hypothetical protein [Mycolicibacterium hassiacum DSM 44199]PZN23904.1 MAG: hypothetical protein DIU75_04255 [Mycolicibacterium hassiacum]VCT89868.1 hypothetical protein MHAS_01568 [Mycolicibacterium hassiacum DSM 44199]
MTLAAQPDLGSREFVIEDIWTGPHASGFGQVGDGRSFSFHVERQQLIVEVYRPRLRGPVPQPEDVVAVATHRVADIDLTDERSLAAAVRDAVAAARPVPRTGR